MPFDAVSPTSKPETPFVPEQNEVHSRYGLKIAMLSNQLDAALRRERELVKALTATNDRLKRFMFLAAEHADDLKRIQSNNSLIYRGEIEAELEALAVQGA